MLAAVCCPWLAPGPCELLAQPIPIPVPGAWGWLIPMFWDHLVAACGCGLAPMLEDQPICGATVDCP